MQRPFSPSLKNRSIFRLSTNERFTLLFVVLTAIVSLLFIIAIMRAVRGRERASLFLWADGALTNNDEGNITIYPRELICSEGGVRIFLVFISCATSIVSCIVMRAIFLTKVYCFASWLVCIHASLMRLFIHASTIIPFGKLHKIHRNTAKIYFILALFHVIGHFIILNIFLFIL